MHRGSPDAARARPPRPVNREAGGPGCNYAGRRNGPRRTGSPTTSEGPLLRALPAAAVASIVWIVTACQGAQEPGTIVFASDREGSEALYVMELESSEVRRLTSDSTSRPSLSPDRSRVAFLSLSPDQENIGSIYTIGLDGSGLTRVTDVLPAWIQGSAWSPDGSRIAFVSYPHGHFDVYTVATDGSELSRITVHDSADVNPAWSPDSEHILFESTRDGNDELYVIGSDGTDPRRLTNDPGSEGLSSWSPDGSRIAFESTRDGDYEIYTMDADGGNVVRLTDNEAVDGGPVWSPNGQRILFHSDRDGNFEIYVMNADGTEQTRLTDNPAKDYQPVW